MICIGDPLTQENEKPKKLEAEIDGEWVSVDYDGSKTILEALMDAGFDPPHSCLAGNCMACVAKVEKGRVCQEELGILTEENVEDREALTCQARGVSEVVKVSYSF
ncbi:MAG: hypothetical protein D6797_00025 [Bdellovibrio sp.]|nr:MAG: hypothetical protein D6797_00025 [Bdellovibrio sp.]